MWVLPASVFLKVDAAEHIKKGIGDVPLQADSGSFRIVKNTGIGPFE